MKQVLIIGGTSGIAKPIIAGLCNLSYEIIFTYNKNEAKALELVSNYHCVARKLDMSNTECVQKFLNEIVAEEAPDALINCAGVLQDGLSLGNIEGLLNSLLNVNFVSPAIIAARVAEHMCARRRGAIVNVTSVAARKPRIGNAVYGSTKAALERFSATLALEVARFKIRTLCVAPGFVDTVMFDEFSQGGRAEIIRNIPTREILTAEQVADTVIAFVTGFITTTGTTIILGNGEYVF